MASAGGSYLPGDWVGKDRLLLFIAEEVASRPPRKGARLDAEKREKAEDKAQGRGGKGRKTKTSAVGVLIVESDDDEGQSKLVIM